MRGILQAFQVIGSILSTKMTGSASKQMRFILILTLSLVLLGFFLQPGGAAR